jgi:NTP pyrophosphatase (non-canonical NTP hydrolase)
MVTNADLASLSERIRDFAIERDWEKFHTPKNLSTALIVEAAELAEHFQWASDAEVGDVARAKRQDLEHELADVFIYLLRLAQVLQVDLIKAAEDKLAVNAKKYPTELVKGSAKKYTEYDSNT